MCFSMNFSKQLKKVNSSFSGKWHKSNHLKLHILSLTAKSKTSLKPKCNLHLVWSNA